MMGKHGFFILFAYGFTAAVILALVIHTIGEYWRLQRSLSRFPPREGDGR